MATVSGTGSWRLRPDLRCRGEPSRSAASVGEVPPYGRDIGMTEGEAIALATTVRESLRQAWW